jgi:hypothetical protein
MSRYGRIPRKIWPGEDWRAKIRRVITGDALVFIALFSRASLPWRNRGIARN